MKGWVINWMDAISFTCLSITWCKFFHWLAGNLGWISQVAAISNVGNNKDISRIILLLRQTTFWDVHPPHPLCIYSFLCVLSASNLFWILKGSCLSNACRASRHFVCFGSKKILLFIYDVHVYRTGGNTRPPDTQFSNILLGAYYFSLFHISYDLPNLKFYGK